MNVSGRKKFVIGCEHDQLKSFSLELSMPLILEMLLALPASLVPMIAMPARTVVDFFASLFFDLASLRAPWILYNAPISPLVGLDISKPLLTPTPKGDPFMCL